jgi:two-component system sensor histidine kinase PilS (NtrC family)
MPLSEVSPQLSQRLATWLSTTLQNPRPFRQEGHLPDVSPTFSYLSPNDRSGDIVILLEDSAQATHRLQQIKLVALGRLTASIAHEVRNPLASISHAAQLLQESPTATLGDKRLVNIIHDNAKRASAIIGNVLDLSHRDKAKPEEFVLLPWLENVRQEFLRGASGQSPQISLQVKPKDLIVRFDTGHLQQVLWQLLSNACAHSVEAGQTPQIQILASVDLSSGLVRPVLDVIDAGPGIPDAESQRIFEPFFSTKAHSTGLGLYIAREVCEANRGQLQYIRSDSGSCFRITFPAISKQERKALMASVRRAAFH